MSFNLTSNARRFNDNQYVSAMTNDDWESWFDFINYQDQLSSDPRTIVITSEMENDFWND